MFISLLHMVHSCLYIVIYSIEDSSLFYDQDAEVFEENGQRIDWVSKLINFLAAMLLCNDFKILFLL